MPNDRASVATLLLGTALVGVIATGHPSLIPALTLSIAAFMGLAHFLKL